MSFFEPMHCRLDAFTALRDQLPDLDTTDGLIRAAVAVSMHELDEPDLVSVETKLDDLADQVQERVAGNDPRALLTHAHQLLFDELRFRGNLGDYDTPENSYLPTVLQTKLGLPITLALLYKAVLERLGVPVVGINAPGHFMVAVPSLAVGGVRAPSSLSIVDPFFGGALLTREEALDRVSKTAGGDLLLDESLDLLPVATHKQWLARLIRNLHLGFDRNGQSEGARAMAEMMRLVEQEAC